MPTCVGSTLDQFRASLYETLCANPDLPDAIALPALEAFHEAHSPPLLQPLYPSRRSVDTIPAVLSLQRPAWLQVLLSRRGFKAGARWVLLGSPTSIPAACMIHTPLPSTTSFHPPPAAAMADNVAAHACTYAWCMATGQLDSQGA
jgi:hypothetical protein